VLVKPSQLEESLKAAIGLGVGENVLKTTHPNKEWQKMEFEECFQC